MHLRTKRLYHLFLLILPTIGFFFGGLLLTLRLWYPSGLAIEQTHRHFTLFGVIFIFWLLVFVGLHLFDLWHHKRFAQWLKAFIMAIMINTILAIIIFYLQKELVVTPRRFLLTDIAITYTAIGLWMSLMRLLFRKRRQTTVHFLGIERINDLLNDLAQKPNATFALAKTNLTEETLSALKASHPEQTWLVLPDAYHFADAALSHLKALHTKGVRLVSYQHFHELYLRCIPLDTVDDWWFLKKTYAHRGLYPLIKRLIDIGFGLSVGLVFSLTFPIVAALIKISGKGPIFFVQERLSLQNKPFKIFKYRTMRTDTRTDTWTEKNDMRITRIGNLLRKTRLDELPQCINLLKGDMSMVGPRPEQVHLSNHLAERIPFFHERHRILPGLTGWAQLHVYASSTEESKKKLEYDFYYLKHQSLLFDLEIIAKTILHLLRISGR